MGTSSADTSARGDSKSPKQSNTKVRGASADPAKQSDLNGKPETAADSDATKPLAPPPRPQAQSNNTPDFFTTQLGGSLSLEPNPFEQSFSGAPPETPGGTKLPSVAALTSPSSLLPGSGVTPFNWGGGSLRTGPLSPAMISGPTNDYFGDTHHLRGGFPTPNESSLRTGLTPGGSGSMFPAASPNSALFAQIAGGATPSTLDFHRTALSAAAAKREQNGAVQPPPSVTSQPPDMSNGAAKAEPKAFDPHDNDAANGLFMLAQGRNGTQPTTSYVVPNQAPGHAHPAPVAPQALDTSPQMGSLNGSISVGSLRGVSEAGSAMSDESEQARPNTRAKGKKNSTAGTTNGRRKADDPPAKGPASKKAKTNGHAPAVANGSLDGHSDEEEEDDMVKHEDGTKTKMTDEEKRKNFLERNRVAALKCRQRKKQWLANLQNKVEMFTTENDSLTSQISQLREEVVNLKTLLLAHKDCPVTQQQGLHGAFMQPMEPFNPQMNPYGMGAPLPNQPVLTGQPVQRRYS